ncbi:MAG: hypothetical protein OSB62_05860 [Alphaproteobacteria bacterium]|nr:hypothetical protein [Alphaproteobacteria bacterium]
MMIGAAPAMPMSSMELSSMGVFSSNPQFDIHSLNIANGFAGFENQLGFGAINDTDRLAPLLADFLTPDAESIQVNDALKEIGAADTAQSTQMFHSYEASIKLENDILTTHAQMIGIMSAGI